VELYKDGTATGNVKELNKENNWTVTFEKLPVSASLGGENHKYTIKEVGESGNIILVDGKRYKVIYEGNMKAGFTITNRKEIPVKPSTPIPNDPKSIKPRVSNANNNEILPKTGDGGNISQYVWLMVTSGISLMLIGCRRKKHEKQK
ncbi:Cna B-type domain-containing protein, partial [Gemella cuniculi]|uniref:Cna B-type domain-containing protein n=1 Tax=Gemella cuniculi TaxID=150240 RepID=UPI000557C71E